MQERQVEVESRTAAYEEAYKVLTSSISAISKSIAGLSTRLKCHTQLLTEMGADSGCNESATDHAHPRPPHGHSRPLS